MVFFSTFLKDKALFFKSVNCFQEAQGPQCQKASLEHANGISQHKIKSGVLKKSRLREYKYRETHTQTLAYF